MQSAFKDLKKMKRVKNNKLQRQQSDRKVLNLKALPTVTVRDVHIQMPIAKLVYNSPALNSLIIQLLLCIVLKEAK